MFGLEFLFSAALFALPLAALPLILHLLNRRKSKTIPFPTLRFIQASVQRSAARRKVRRWLLMAVRMLLLALLIWAVAQPARTHASGFFSSDSQSAVIIVDTSWSMQYRKGERLLDQAQQVVQELLRKELKDASVLLMSSQREENTGFQAAADLLTNWRPIEPSSAAVPLWEKLTRARDLLINERADEKVVALISDFQSREFPRPISQLAGGEMRVIAIDLHPDPARSAGIAAITLWPSVPIAGLRITANVQLYGPPGDSRPVQLELESLEGQELLNASPVMTTFDSFGQGSARFELQMPAGRWQLLTAFVPGEDPMSWDDSRTVALELPIQRRVAVLDGASRLDSARRLVQLALDPDEGKLGTWPLKVEKAAQITGQNAVVALVDSPVDSGTARQWRDFVAGGGTLVLMLKPGVERLGLATLEALLPGKPYAMDIHEPLHFVPAEAAQEDASTASLLDKAKCLEGLRARRLVGMAVAEPRSTRMLIASASGERTPAAERDGLLYLRRVGAGRVFTWTCLPNSVDTNLATHPLFLPLVVNQCLPPPDSSDATNGEIGQPLAWTRGAGEMEIRTPRGESYRVASKEGKLVYEGTQTPGIYQWYQKGDLMGIASMMPPGEEAQSSYRPAKTLLPDSPHVLVARSLTEMRSGLAELSKPEPEWTPPLATALVLLCLESLLASEIGVWRKLMGG